MTPMRRKRSPIASLLDQVRDLAGHGVKRFHIYTMNRAPLTAAICEALGLTATVPPPP